MKALGPAWGGGLSLGLSLGIFVTAVLVETESLPPASPAWKFIRSESALAAALIAVIGARRARREQAE